MSVHKKFVPNRSSSLAGYRQHIYIRMSCFIIYITILIFYSSVLGNHFIMMRNRILDLPWNWIRIQGINISSRISIQRLSLKQLLISQGRIREGVKGKFLPLDKSPPPLELRARSHSSNLQE